MKQLLCVLIPFLLVSCESAASPKEIKPAKTQPWLENQAASRGIHFEWVSGDAGEYYMPEIIGGGAAMIDIDNDHDLDLYFVQGGHLNSETSEHNVLLRNDNGTFIDITNESNAGDTGYGMGVATGDYDNDGDVDLYVTNVGRNTLLQNNGNGTFSDVTISAGVGDDGWGASAAFADFDADGDLDLYAINYLVWSHTLDLECFNPMGVEDYCSPTNYMSPARDVLYRNNGDGTFTDVSEFAGIGAQFGTGLGVLCNDYTGDGLIDIFVANDGMADHLWRNNGDWTFTDVAAMRGCALDDEGREKAGMGVTSEDFDFDGDLDILVCNLTGESDSLFRNDGDYFTDVTASHGIRTATRHATRFGLGWVDFNNDGILDIYEANGRVQLVGKPHTEDPFAEPNYLLEGTSTGWTVHTNRTLAGIHTSRAAVFGDVDNDGGIDVLVINRDAPAYLLMNVHPDRANAATFSVQTRNGRDAIGAILTGIVNGVHVTTPVQSAWSYMAANDPRVHIGLGKASSIENVAIKWVDGTTSTFGTFSNGFHVLQQ